MTAPRDHVKGACISRDEQAGPVLSTYQIRIRETGRTLALGFASGFTFDATPETVAEFTDQATAYSVLKVAQAEIDAGPKSVGMKSVATLEVVRRNYFPGAESFEVWKAEQRAETTHREARLVLAERRPAFLVRPRRPIDLGAFFDGLAAKVVGA